MSVRLAVLTLVLLTALLLQTVVAPGLAVAGYRPDLVVLTVLAFALADGAGTGARYGFAAGLAVDLLSGAAPPVGISALVLLLVGYTVGAIRPYLSGTAIVGEVTVAFVASAAVVLSYGLLSILLEAAAATLLETVRTALAVGVFNGILGPVVFRPLRRLSRRASASPTAALARLS